MANKEMSKYGKRPLRQWIVLYVVVGVIIYAGIYYLYTHRSMSSAGQSTTHSSSLY
jgi:hypothetical protein